MNNYLLIDVGGSSIKYALCDKEQHLTAKGKYPLPMSSPKANFYAAINHIRNMTDRTVDGVCISMPGIINKDEGINYRSSMLRDTNVPVVRELEDLLGVPVSVINDGYAAGLAEVGFGNLKGISNGLVMVLGTGIGGALIIDGKLHTGKRYAAANYSFLYTDQNNPTDPSTMFTFYNGIQGLKNAIQASSGLEDVDGIRCFELIKEGNKEVEQGLKNFCDTLAFNLYNLHVVLDLDRVLIGGGISQEPLFLDYVKEAVDRRWSTAALPFAKPELMLCRYSNDANLLGALYNWQLQHEQ